MRNRIKIITPPDILFDRAETIVAVCPGESLKAHLHKYLENTDKDTNVYLYDKVELKWLFTVARTADYVLIDIDNCDQETSHFLSYLLSFSNTYYKCDHMQVSWDILNKNRFYDFPNLKEESDERK